jgi:hypothetical protein
MSLGIVIKGSEGMVLAADSRVTLFNQVQNPQVQGQTFLIPATFDNATKLLKVNDQDYVGSVTYGLGAMSTPDGPRTMQSFIPEFEDFLKKKFKDLLNEKGKVPRLPVEEFAKSLSEFFSDRWAILVNRPLNPGESNIEFLVGGYDENAAYGRTFSFTVPAKPTPIEFNAGPGQFGISWGGQQDLVYRLLYGFDRDLPGFLQQALKQLPAADLANFTQQIQTRFAAGIPYQFLPLQDCVDLAVFLIKSTIDFQQFRTNLRGVGGVVEVATITRTQGLKFVSERTVAANTEHPEAR